MKIKSLVLIFLIILSVFFVFYALPRVVKVNKIVCVSQYGACQKDLEDMIRKGEKKSYYQALKIVKEGLQKELLVKDYSFYYKFPGIVNVYLILDKSYFAVRSLGSGKIYLINKNGIVVLQSDKTELPILDVGLDFKVGENIGAGLTNGLKTYALFTRLYNTDYATLKESYFETKVKKGPLILFPLDADSESLVGAARLIIFKLNSEQQNFRMDKPVAEIVVDLRFKNPVLR
jgi:hypothetical protein